MNTQSKELHELYVSSINQVAAILKIRDPYTSGHQIRVAELAVEIGRALGFDDFRLLGLELAAKVHDIGKLSIPSEILVKPGRISHNEFSLIQEHPAAGFHILKMVNYPWPIAEVALQHHEKIDGSGYPNKLTEKEILLESKIVSVSDIVESMTTHRPYRPALGINNALDELEKLKGTKLDNEVCNIAIQLITKEHFVFDYTKK